MFFCAALVLLFIIKLRFPKGKNIHHIIETRYGRPLLNLFRKFKKFFYNHIFKKKLQQYIYKVSKYEILNYKTENVSVKESI